MTNKYPTITNKSKESTSFHIYIHNVISYSDFTLKTTSKLIISTYFYIVHSMEKLRKSYYFLDPLRAKMNLSKYLLRRRHRLGARKIIYRSCGNHVHLCVFRLIKELKNQLESPFHALHKLPGILISGL